MQKSLTRVIGEGTFWTTSSSIVLKLVSLFALFVILHKLSVYEYGLVKLASSVVPLLGFLALPGINNVVIADMGVEKGQGNIGKVRAIFNNYFQIQLLLAFIGWAIVFFGANIIANFYQGQISYLFQVASFSFLLSPFRTMVVTAFSVYLKFFQKSVFSFAEEFSKFLLIIILLLVFPTGPVGVMWAQVLAQVVALLVIAPAFFRVHSKFSHERAHQTLPLFNSIYLHGKWSMFATYLSSFGRNMRLWIIKFILGTEAVGIFTVAQGLISNTRALFPLSGVITPIIPQYVAQKERFLKLVNKGLKYQFLGYLALGLVAFLFFPQFISLLFPNYVASVPLFEIMLLFLIPASFTSVFNPIYFAFKEQKNLFYAMIRGTILILLLAPPALYFFGIKGIAFEFVLNGAFFTFDRYRSLRKLYPDLKISAKEFFTMDAEDYRILKKIGVVLKLRR